MTAGPNPLAALRPRAPGWGGVPPAPGKGLAKTASLTVAAFLLEYDAKIAWGCS